MATPNSDNNNNSLQLLENNRLHQIAIFVFAKVAKFAIKRLFFPYI